jgi:hypothetical protein
LANLHRPSLAHVGAMLMGLAVSALILHFWLHGGL